MTKIASRGSGLLPDHHGCIPEAGQCQLRVVTAFSDTSGRLIVKKMTAATGQYKA